MCNNNTDGNCVSDILGVILALQQSANPENCLDSCDRPLLGGGPNCLICNTRPVMLYTCSGNGAAWTMPISKDTTDDCSTDPTLCSSVFRVEKLEGNCATFRVLTENPDTTSTNPYIATSSFFTMNLDCCCVIRCLTDTFIDCVL